MNKNEIEHYAEYEVYTVQNNEVDVLCLCNDRVMAETIAKRLVMGAAKPNIKIYVTRLCYLGDYAVPGGGEYGVFWRDDEGKLRQHGVS